MDKRKKILLPTLLLLLAAGVCMILYPVLLADRTEAAAGKRVEVFRERHSYQVTIPAEPEETAAAPTLPEEIARLEADMAAYNSRLYESGQKGLVDSLSMTEEVIDPAAYGLEDVVGIVRIPKISVEMPLYLGASLGHLDKGFAQISNTSLPVGGENTNCVIAGHRGWNGAPYLRDVEELAIGDPIFLEMPWGVLEYRVAGFQIIAPNDLQSIRIQPGKDMVTLSTCHPYRVSTHRLLVYCERYTPEAAPESTTPVETQTIEEWLWSVSIASGDGPSPRQEGLMEQALPWIAALAFLFLLSVMTVLLRRRKQR